MGLFFVFCFFFGCNFFFDCSLCLTAACPLPAFALGVSWPEEKNKKRLEKVVSMAQARVDKAIDGERVRARAANQPFTEKTGAGTGVGWGVGGWQLRVKRTGGKGSVRRGCCTNCAPADISLFV